MRIFDHAAVRPVINKPHGYQRAVLAPGGGLDRIDLNFIDRVPPINIGLELIGTIRIAAVEAVLKIIRKHAERGGLAEYKIAGH